MSFVQFSTDSESLRVIKFIMDVVMIFSTETGHMKDIEHLLKALVKFRLKISSHKYQSFRTKLAYMGVNFMIRRVDSAIHL